MSIINNVDEFIKKNRDFIVYLKEMEESLTPLSLEEIVKQAGGPEHVAVLSVDVIEGFCRIGPLASDRVKGIIGPVVELFKKAYSLGIRNFALPQDSHPEDSPEFESFPVHCVRGSEEAKTVKEFRELPFFNEMKVIAKESVNSAIETDLKEWLLERDLKAVIVAGDCTDLCTYQLALFVKHLSNARGYRWKVIMPVNAVETYDMPVETARQFGAMPHPGDLLQLIFLYHLKLNGIEMAGEIV